MIFVLFLLEIFILWRLSRKTTSRLLTLLPRPIFVILFLPGTFIHELSHYLMAKLLFVPVGKLTVTPKYQNKELILGSVAIAKKDILRRLVIGAAPIIFGAAILLGLIYASIVYKLYLDYWLAGLMAYVVFVIGNTMFSSKQDMEGAWRLMLVIASLIIIFSLLGVRIEVDTSSGVYENIERTVKLACAYLMVPIVIDAALLLLINKCNILNYGRRSR